MDYDKEFSYRPFSEPSRLSPSDLKRIQFFYKDGNNSAS